MPPNGFLNTTAGTSLRGGEWTLNGKKSFVINGKNADLFLVLAGTKVIDKLGDKVDAITAFLIENDMNGVEVKDSDRTLGCNGTQQCEVTFNNVELTEGIVARTLVVSVADNVEKCRGAKSEYCFSYNPNILLPYRSCRWHFRKWIRSRTEIIDQIPATSWHSKRRYDEKDCKSSDKILHRHFSKWHEIDVN